MTDGPRFEITMDKSQAKRRICFENYLRIESNNRASFVKGTFILQKFPPKFIIGICTRNFVRKTFFTCGENEETVSIEFYNLHKNPFFINVQAVDANPLLQALVCPLSKLVYSVHFCDEHQRCFVKTNHETSKT